MFGKLVEEEEGAWGLVLSYLICGIGGNIASVIMLGKKVGNLKDGVRLISAIAGRVKKENKNQRYGTCTKCRSSALALLGPCLACSRFPFWFGSGLIYSA